MQTDCCNTHARHRVGLSKTTISKGLDAYDFILNLFDLFEAMGVYRTQHLSEVGVPFSGERLRRYDPTQKELKIQAATCQVDTAPWAYVTKALGPDDAAALASRLGGFPIFKKSQHGGDSIGITEKSRCTNVDELCEQSGYWMDREGGCMVERFIDGDEYSVCSLTAPCMTAYYVCFS